MPLHAAIRKTTDSMFLTIKNITSESRPSVGVNIPKVNSLDTDQLCHSACRNETLKNDDSNYAIYLEYNLKNSVHVELALADLGVLMKKNRIEYVPNINYFYTKENPARLIEVLENLRDNYAKDNTTNTILNSSSSKSNPDANNNQQNTDTSTNTSACTLQ
jgi:hypothetical protein